MLRTFIFANYIVFFNMLNVIKYNYSTQINRIVYQKTADNGKEIGMAMATKNPRYFKRKYHVDCRFQINRDSDAGVD